MEGKFDNLLFNFVEIDNTKKKYYSLRQFNEISAANTALQETELFEGFKY